MTRVLVTGGSGFLGSALCNRMADEGHEVFSFDKSPPAPGKVRHLAGDIRQRGFLDIAADDMGAPPDVVFHMAAMNGATRDFYALPWDVLDVQIRGTLNVIDWCIDRGVRNLMLFSSSEVYNVAPVIPTPEDVARVIPDISNPRFSYSGGKIASELLAWHSGIERVTLALPHNVYGANAGYGHVIPEMILRSARTPPGGQFDIHGATTRSFIYIDDFTDAMMAIWKNVSEREGRVREVFHVGTEEQVSMVALAGMISDIMGRKQADRYAYKFKTHPAPAGGTPARCPDTKKVRGLGWAPKVSLREGLERTVAAYRACADKWPAEAT